MNSDQYLALVIESFRDTSKHDLINFIQSNKSLAYAFVADLLSRPNLFDLNRQQILTTADCILPRIATESTENPFIEIGEENLRNVFNSALNLVVSGRSTTSQIAANFISRLIRCDHFSGNQFGFFQAILEMFLNPPNAQSISGIILIMCDCVSYMEELQPNYPDIANQTLLYLSNHREISIIYDQAIRIVDKLLQKDFLCEIQNSNVIFQILAITIENPSNKSASYACWSQIFYYYYPTVEQVGHDIIIQSFKDVQTQDTGLQVNILSMWKSIIHSEKRITPNFEIIQQHLNDLILLTTAIASTATQDVCLVTEENDPNIVATTLIQKISKLKFANEPLIQRYIQIKASENPGERETALAIIGSIAIYGDVSMIYEDCLQYIVSCFSDSVSRVRENSMWALLYFVKSVSDQKEKNYNEAVINVASQYISVLTEFAENDVDTAETASKVLVNISTNLQENEQMQIAEFFINTMFNEDAKISRCAADSINELVATVLPKTVIASLLPSFVSSAGTILEAANTSDMPQKLFICIQESLFRLTDTQVVVDEFDDLWALLEAAITSGVAEYCVMALVPLAALARAVNADDFGEERLNEMMTFLVEALSKIDEPDTFKNASVAIKFVFDRFDISNYVLQILEICVALLNNSGMQLKMKPPAFQLIRDCFRSYGEISQSVSEEVITPLIKSIEEVKAAREQLEMKYEFLDASKELQNQVEPLIGAFTAAIAALHGDNISEIVTAQVALIEFACCIRDVSSRDMIEEIVIAIHQLVVIFGDEFGVWPHLSQIQSVVMVLRTATANQIESEKVGQILGIISQ